MILRRILIKGDNTLADLHHTIQVAMGWEDYYLNQFKIHGKTVSIYNSEGMTSPEGGSCNAFLKDFRFIINECFYTSMTFSSIGNLMFG